MAQVNFKLIYEKTTWVEVDIIYDIILRCVYGQKVLLPSVDEKKRLLSSLWQTIMYCNSTKTMKNKDKHNILFIKPMKAKPIFKIHLSILISIRMDPGGRYLSYCRY